MKAPLPLPLPTTLTSAISAIKWPLFPNSVPMYYESLTTLSQLRQQSTGSTVSSMNKMLIHNLDESIDDLVNNSNQNDQESTRHYIMTSMALICLGNGLLDEAHDLITPLSWTEETHFGGPSLCIQAKPEVISLASYVHSLVHRREGYARGEFGMIGWQNANYWSSAAKSRDDNYLPYVEVHRQILSLANNEFGEESIRWCKDHIIDEWEPRALHELCAYTSRDDTGASKDNFELTRFAERAAEVELLMLLQFSLEKAGYNYNVFENNTMTNTPSNFSLDVDETVALAIANKISSAHLGAFQSNGIVTIRNLFRGCVSESYALSVAAGLACRLLRSAGCIYQSLNPISSQLSYHEKIYIVLKNDESESTYEQSFQEQTYYGGGPLSIGDALVIKIDENNMNDYQTTSNKSGHYTFIPCFNSNQAATFIDKFHNSRGETPTTVLQWSKGTIFESDAARAKNNS